MSVCAQCNCTLGGLLAVLFVCFSFVLLGFFFKAKREDIDLRERGGGEMDWDVRREEQPQMGFN